VRVCPYGRTGSGGHRSSRRQNHGPHRWTEMTSDEPTYRVVRNDEDQYSIRPATIAVPGSRHLEGTEGSRADCLAHIDAALPAFRTTAGWQNRAILRSCGPASRRSSPGRRPWTAGPACRGSARNPSRTTGSGSARRTTPSASSARSAGVPGTSSAGERQTRSYRRALSGPRAMLECESACSRTRTQASSASRQYMTRPRGPMRKRRRPGVVQPSAA
jgi:MbtH protein